MATHTTDDVGRVLGGRYRIVAPIGTGGSARVYLADDVTLRRRVAVKVLHDALAQDDAFLRRFRAEAQSAASLNHPHVLGVYDWGYDEVPFLVSEYLAGGSLRSMLDAGHSLTSSQALLVGMEAARGLDYAHGEGLVHRDIKPANLLFGEGGRLRIADFGLARALAEAGWTEPDGSIVGTVRYAAPEQARGERVGPAADVYALALVINECVTGEVPFARDTAVATLMARAETPFEPHADLGPLMGPVRRAGALDPTERPSAGELAASLLSAAGELSRPGPLPLVGAIDAEPGPSEGDDATVHVGSMPGAAAADIARVDEEPKRRWPWVALAALTIVAAVAGGVGAWFATRPTTHEVPDLVGQSEDDAIEVALDNDWEPELIQVREPDTVAGEVVRTEPSAGEDLEEGEILQVFVSLGEPLVAVPDLAGMTIEEAGAALARDGRLLGSRTLVNDEDVERGRIIDTDLAVGLSELEPGEEVDVLVSDGPEERAIPAVPESLDPAEAAAALEALRFVPVEDREPSETVPEGLVIGFDPATGVIHPADADVAVVISSGPPPVEVPELVGIDVEQATAELEALGFDVTGVDGSPSGFVIGTDPRAGQVVEYGSPITILTEGGRN